MTFSRMTIGPSPKENHRPPPHDTTTCLSLSLGLILIKLDYHFFLVRNKKWIIITRPGIQTDLMAGLGIIWIPLAAIIDRIFSKRQLKWWASARKNGGRSKFGAPSFTHISRRLAQLICYSTWWFMSAFPVLFLFLFCFSSCFILFCFRLTCPLLWIIMWNYDKITAWLIQQSWRFFLRLCWPCLRVTPSIRGRGNCIHPPPAPGRSPSPSPPLHSASSLTQSRNAMRMNENQIRLQEDAPSIISVVSGECSATAAIRCN